MSKPLQTVSLYANLVDRIKHKTFYEEGSYVKYNRHLRKH